MINKQINKKIIFQWAKDLFPLNRSLTGEGNYKTLNYIRKILPHDLAYLQS